MDITSALSNPYVQDFMLRAGFSMLQDKRGGIAGGFLQGMDYADQRQQYRDEMRLKDFDREKFDYRKQRDSQLFGWDITKWNKQFEHQKKQDDLSNQYRREGLDLQKAEFQHRQMQDNLLNQIRLLQEQRVAAQDARDQQRLDAQLKSYEQEYNTNELKYNEAVRQSKAMEIARQSLPSLIQAARSGLADEFFSQNPQAIAALADAGYGDWLIKTFGEQRVPFTIPTENGPQQVMLPLSTVLDIWTKERKVQHVVAQDPNSPTGWSHYDPSTRQVLVPGAANPNADAVDLATMLAELEGGGRGTVTQHTQQINPQVKAKIDALMAQGVSVERIRRDLIAKGLNPTLYGF